MNDFFSAFRKEIFWRFFVKFWICVAVGIVINFFYECIATGGNGRIVDKYSSQWGRHWPIHYFRLESGHTVSAPSGIFDVGRLNQTLDKDYLSATYRFDGAAYSAWPGFFRDIVVWPTCIAFIFALLGASRNENDE